MATRVRIGRWTGGNDSGAREPTEAEVKRVLAYIERCRGRRCATTTELAAGACDVPGRTFREIVSRFDGIRYLVAYQGDKLWLAETPDEAESFTRKLDSQAEHMSDRVARRRAFASRLDGMQGQLL